MIAAVWGTPQSECITDFPAKALIRFTHNSPLVASHKKAFMVYHQRWQVRSVYIDASSFYYFRLQSAVCRVNSFSIANQAAAPVNFCGCRLVTRRQDETLGGETLDG
jgi:hypothetical protein